MGLENGKQRIVIVGGGIAGLEIASAHRAAVAHCGVAPGRPRLGARVEADAAYHRGRHAGCFATADRLCGAGARCALHL